MDLVKGCETHQATEVLDAEELTDCVKVSYTESQKKEKALIRSGEHTVYDNILRAIHPMAHLRARAGVFAIDASITI